MRDLCRLIGWMVVDLIRSRVMLEAEIWTLRQQINVLRRTAPKKLSFCAVDRMIFVGLYRLFPKICDALAIVITVVARASDYLWRLVHARGDSPSLGPSLTASRSTRNTSRERRTCWSSAMTMRRVVPHHP